MAPLKTLFTSSGYSTLLHRTRFALLIPTLSLIFGLLGGCGANARQSTGGGGAAGVSGTAGHSGSMPDHGGAGSSGEAGSGGEGGTSDGGEGGASEGGNGGEGGASEDGKLSLTFDDAFVIKAQLRSDGSLLVLLDKPLDMRVDWGSPQRELLLLSESGQPLASLASSTASRFLLDFAAHDSGDVSVLYSSADEYSLERFDVHGQSLGASILSDPLIDQDPPVWNGSPSAAVEPLTRDAGRIAAFGEQLVVATRTGRHSVIAQRFGFFNAGSVPAFHAEWRTLVVPPYGITAVGLYGGSYDTFDAVHAQVMLHLAVDQAGTIYVGVQHPRVGDLNLIKAHAKVFGETLVGDADALDLYVTRIASGGTRIGTTVVGTPEDDQLFGLRGGQDSALVIGRKEYWNDDGTGFDALIARLEGKSGALEVRELHVKRSDLAFDAVALEDGSWLVAGASDWQQNPSGASVSEESQAFVQHLSAAGEGSTIALENGARHNEGRTLVDLGAGRFLIGGMTDGPGTHSGDAEPSHVRASGFLREVRVHGIDSSAR